MNRLGLIRAGWGVLLLVAPGPVAGRLTGRPLDRRGRQVARVLGARQLGQAIVSGRHPAYPVLALGVEVDCLHAATMMAWGWFDPARRRHTLADAAVAATFAVSGAVAARSCLQVPPPAGWVGLRDRGAEVVARRLVPGYRRDA